jgi:hypothetical protein
MEGMRFAVIQEYYSPATPLIKNTGKSLLIACKIAGIANAPKP